MSKAESESVRSGFRFDLRVLLAAITLIGLLLAPVAWLEHRYWATWRRFHSIEDQIDSLKGRSPPELTSRQWESAVRWTRCLHGNNVGFYEPDRDELQRFERQLKQKLAGKVDMATIHWIWDQYPLVWPEGRNYQRFRRQMMYEIEEAIVDW